MACPIVTAASAASVLSPAPLTVTVCGVLQMPAPLGVKVSDAPVVTVARCVDWLLTATVTLAVGAVLSRTV